MRRRRSGVRDFVPLNQINEYAPLNSSSGSSADSLEAIEECIGRIEIHCSTDLVYIMGRLVRVAGDIAAAAIERKHRGMVCSTPRNVDRTCDQITHELRKLAQVQEVFPEHYSVDIVYHTVASVCRVIRRTAFVHSIYTNGLLACTLRELLAAAFGRSQRGLGKKEGMQRLEVLVQELTTLNYEAVNQPLHSVTEEDEAFFSNHRAQRRTRKAMRRCETRDTSRSRVSARFCPR